MTKTKLGKTGIEVSSVGIGTWAWGDQLFWNYGKNYDANSVKEAFEATLKAGITFFDTAEVYGLGESEKLLGQFMSLEQQPIDIATKYGPAPWRFGKESVYEAVSESLKRLKLQQVTLYQVHWPFTFFMSQETLMNALADEVEKGRIKSIGVSNYSADEMQKAHDILATRGIPLAVNQVQYSLLARKIETNGILETAKKLDITILAYSPLAQGLLTGKYSKEKGNIPDGARKFDSRFSAKGLEKISTVIEALTNLAAKYQKTPAQIALNWLIAQGNVIPIPGAKNAAQAMENAGAIGWSLSPEDVVSLDQVT